jgi:segregation and condensation protein A
MTAGEGYGVRLDEVNFEGPLDLLLFLIQKHEIDVSDIPMAVVTEQFLAYLERITAANLEAAGDFLLMAATLLRIKSQMLLPSPEGPDTEDLEDPRRELVSRILEYQQYKEIAQDLREREAQALLLHPRGLRPPPEGGEAPGPAPEEERTVSLKDLLRAFAAVLAARPTEAAHHVDVVRVTLEEKVHHIRRVLAQRGEVLFDELFASDAPRIELVVTLIALLEMVRNREVRLEQGANFGEILIRSAGEASDGEPQGGGRPAPPPGTGRMEGE